MTKLLTQESLATILRYDPETGAFFWRVKRKGTRGIGQRAGRLKGNGYRSIRIDGVAYYEHNLAWLYLYGDLMRRQIDHRDRDRQNNAQANLRIATATQNQMNRGVPKNNTSGFKGVSLARASGLWVAQIEVNYRAKRIGGFENKSDAIDARLRAERELFGEFAR